jgi:outer membrane receptor protein involved in Fe transport
MKLALRGASGVALLVGLSSGFQTAAAQQTPAAPANPNQTVTTTQQAQAPAAGPQQAPPAPQAAAQQGEKVTITGSLIATAPEDAPKPVEVYTRDELKEIGSPSVAEFIRDLSIASDSDIGGLESSGDGTGETTGYAPANLRGLGDTATLTLLNGRRLSTDNGTGADLNTIPSNALGSVEILRDGASTTYGAGAVGGVINLRTRRDLDAPEITLRHEAYEGSAGEWALEAATGWVGDSGNILLTYAFDTSPELRYGEREFSSQPFAVNPTGYTLDNGSYTMIENHLYTSGTQAFVSIGTPACTSTATGPATATCVSAASLAGAGVLPVVTGAPQTVNTPNFWLPGGAAGHTDPRRRMMDLTAAQCTNAGGAPVQDIQPGARFSTTSPANARLNNGCALPLSRIYSLVNEEESHRMFGEVNVDLNENMSMTVNVLYSTLDVVGANAPSEQASNAATLPFVTAASTGPTQTAATVNATICGSSCGYMIPVNVPIYNAAGTAITGSVRNPYVDNFLTRAGQNPASYGLGDALYVGPGWRPLLFGGNPLWDDGRVKDRSQRERFQIVAEASGEFADGLFAEGGLLSFLNGINYRYSGQFNKQQSTIRDNLLLTARLQNALLGYGGPACEARDRVATPYNIVPATTVTSTTAQASNNQRAYFNSTIGVQSDTAPGTAGCFFFNPFNSSWQTSSLTGANNSVANGGVYGGAGYENSQELVQWLFRERIYETIREALIFDTVWSGEIPGIELPGGAISWAAGLNWRQTEYRQLPQGSTAETAVAQQPCAFPAPQFISQGATRKPTGEPDQFVGGAGCATVQGGWTSTGRYLSVYRDEQVFAYYAEAGLPVLDNLNFSASWRREEFNNGRITGDIWNVAGKYDITDELYVRGSYGTNFRATASLNERPGSIECGTRLSGVLFGRVGNVAPIPCTIISEGLKPEDDRNLNLGIGYQTDDLFGGRLRASLDFFEIQLLGQVVGGSTAILTPAIDAVFRNPDGSVTVGTPQFEAALANCSAPAIIFWGFNTPDGSCQPGVTGADVTTFFQITDNGGGFITNGLDYSINYSIPVFDGRFSVDLRATQTLVYKDKGTVIAGVELESAASQLGLTAGNGANRSVEWSGTGILRYSNDEHTVSLRSIYQSGQTNRGYLACLPPYFDPATNTQITPPSPVGGSASCGTGLTAAYLNQATGGNLDDPTNGAIQFSSYGVHSKDRLTFDLNYIYSPTWMEGLEFGLSIENIFNKDPIHSQNSRGFVAGNPRGRIFQLQVTKRY